MTSWQPRLDPSGPRYLAIADAIAAAVADGTLAPGARLPTHRDLAWRLGVTVGTVTRAYAEAERRGLIAGEVGRGTFVRDAGANGRYLGHPTLPAVSEPRILLHHAEPPAVPARAAWSASLRDIAADPRSLELLDYPPSPGRPAHRAAAAAWLARCGVEAAPERIFLANGAHAGLLAVLMALARPGDRMLAATLNYPGVYAQARQLGLRLEPVAGDAGGILPEALEAACRAGEARLLYLVPTLHNPTSATLDGERRMAIAEIARRHDLLVIEDDVFRRLAEDLPPPIAALAPERSFYIVSLSKTTAPGLRCGFVACPPDRFAEVLRALDASSGKPAPLAAELGRRWIEDGTAERILTQVRAELRARADLACSLLAGASFTSAPGSLYLWLRLPEPWRPSDFVAAALERDVLITPAQPFAFQSRHEERAVRLCLGGPADRASLQAGLERLAALLRQAPAARYESLV